MNGSISRHPKKINSLFFVDLRRSVLNKHSNFLSISPCLIVNNISGSKLVTLNIWLEKKRWATHKNAYNFTYTHTSSCVCTTNLTIERVLKTCSWERDLYLIKMTYYFTIQSAFYYTLKQNATLWMELRAMHMVCDCTKNHVIGA